ncbi:trypsin-like peptidase domain-containing protein [Streptomyces sp. Je 1-79]|uniref:S1C family serine protease n=1 Tax=Streptomyces sp. Je 1-79 TaxID=2943847 RepID=UPI0021A55387|nr:trypsin-like peptidase domain-containing protein [Streptomyces sp. Je 1-79]MCT4355441.1 trypsin-like peptidase domain-containing protein [Streptomyces sp. Je 1-79]
MNDGKPTGQKPKWWSRPASTPPAGETADPPAADEGDFTLAAPATPTPEAASPEPPSPEAASPEAPSPEPPSPEPPAPEAVTVAVSVPQQAQAEQPEPQPQQQPLHEPDEYRTPPYGGPGPWAPAPPVQRPVATPAHGVPVPPQPAAPQSPVAPQTAVPQQPAAPQPVAPQPVASQPAQWVQYDPWGAPGAPSAPLTVGTEPPVERRRSRRGVALAGALTFALITGVVGGAVGAYVERHGGITTVELPQAGTEDSGRAPDSVAGIAASALPSVVTLHVSGTGSSGTGTGFVLDTQGHILTNNHVVDAAAASGKITVTFSSGETASAKLVGKDSGYDLAVVKVTGVTGLKPLPLGNSDNVRVGDPVVAIGAPFDLQNTVTSGIISAKERPITAGGEKGDGSDISYVDALQTDAPINPGNSGGPLVDSKARVIGINSAIRAAGDGSGDGAGAQSGSIGLGFAIPINQGKRVAEELINTGKATHPVIGVSLDMQFNGDGARVGEKGKDGSASVTPGGPAAKAGIRAGDVITKVDGQRVHSGEELIVKIRAHRPGDRLELTLLRGGKEQTRTLTLGSSQGD